MKLVATAIATFAFVASVSAQAAHVEFPADGTSLTAGSSFTVDVVRPMTISSSVEVAIVLGLSSCGSRENGQCLSAKSSMGTILYNDKYDPRLDEDRQHGEHQPHQNFSLTIPEDTPKGAAQLNFAHFYLLGASVSPVVSTQQVDVTIV